MEWFDCNGEFFSKSLRRDVIVVYKIDRFLVFMFKFVFFLKIKVKSVLCYKEGRGLDDWNVLRILIKWVFGIDFYLFLRDMYCLYLFVFFCWVSYVGVSFWSVGV